jgi:hypothetical protein
MQGLQKSDHAQNLDFHDCLQTFEKELLENSLITMPITLMITWDDIIYTGNIKSQICVELLSFALPRMCVVFTRQISSSPSSIVSLLRRCYPNSSLTHSTVVRESNTSVIKHHLICIPLPGSHQPPTRVWIM